MKQKGNEAVYAEDYDSAVVYYAKAIALEPSNHVLYSNRSAAYMKMGRYDDALADAERTIKIKEDWAKVCRTSNLWQAALVKVAVTPLRVKKTTNF